MKTSHFMQWASFILEKNFFEKVYSYRRKENGSRVATTRYLCKLPWHCYHVLTLHSSNDEAGSSISLPLVFFFHWPSLSHFFRLDNDIRMHGRGGCLISSKVVHFLSDWLIHCWDGGIFSSRMWSPILPVFITFQGLKRILGIIYRKIYAWLKAVFDSKETGSKTSIFFLSVYFDRLSNWPELQKYRLYIDQSDPVSI